MWSMQSSSSWNQTNKTKDVFNDKEFTLADCIAIAMEIYTPFDWEEDQ